MKVKEFGENSRALECHRNPAQAFETTIKTTKYRHRKPKQIKIEREVFKNSLLFSLFSGKIAAGCRQAVCLPIRMKCC
jgi:hypothetical protein